MWLVRTINYKSLICWFHWAWAKSKHAVLNKRGLYLDSRRTLNPMHSNYNLLQSGFMLCCKGALYIHSVMILLLWYQRNSSAMQNCRAGILRKRRGGSRNFEKGGGGEKFFMLKKRSTRALKCKLTWFYRCSIMYVIRIEGMLIENRVYMAVEFNKSSLGTIKKKTSDFGLFSVRLMFISYGLPML